MQAAAEQQFDAWRAALAWQRRIDAALRPLGLTHSRYLVLDAAAELVTAYQDAVAQWEIAERAGFDRTTTSRIANRLAKDGLIDRGVDGLDGRFWRILVTGKGHDVLSRADAAVDHVAASLGA